MIKRQRNKSNNTSNNLKLRLRLRDEASISEMLPTLSTLAGRIFHRCITTGIIIAAMENNQIGFIKCIYVV